MEDEQLEMDACAIAEEEEFIQHMCQQHPQVLTEDEARWLFHRQQQHKLEGLGGRRELPDT